MSVPCPFLKGGNARRNDLLFDGNENSCRQMTRVYWDSQVIMCINMGRGASYRLQTRVDVCDEVGVGIKYLLVSTVLVFTNQYVFDFDISVLLEFDVLVRKSIIIPY